MTAAADAMSGPAALRRAQRRDRAVLLALLAAASAAAWAWTAWMAERMGGHHGHVHGLGLGPLFAMWAVMMAGMMIPPEVPVLLRLARTRRESLGRSPLSGTAAFLLGYLVPWTAFSLGAAALQALLEARGLMGHGMATTSRELAGALLLAAGAVQLSPLKRACLDRCSTASSGRAGGAAGSLAAGFGYGTLSIASCGLLMLILFATGVMSLPWMVLLTALLLAEKVAPRPWRLPAAIGVLLVAWGVLTLAS
ncbi:MAG TPA: DUF2182 domain-containing protein [Anaeromyxobacteraceae bacterium]|nr:DUF2182 domain-containing protein [Anaeromyxobacteraceae bacterium]